MYFCINYFLPLISYKTEKFILKFFSVFKYWYIQNKKKKPHSCAYSQSVIKVQVFYPLPRGERWDKKKLMESLHASMCTFLFGL